MNRMRKKIHPILKIFLSMLAAALLGIVAIKIMYGLPIVVDRTKFTLSKDDAAMKITFVVVDANGEPVQGIVVDSMSSSGSAGSAVTNAKGEAFIEPGEMEVEGVWANGKKASFKRNWLFDQIFLPSCLEGLRVTVVLPSP